MARHTLNRLSSRKVTSALKKPGRYNDGGGLHLVVPSNGAPKWVFRFTGRDMRPRRKPAAAELDTNLKQRDMGLGLLRDVQISEARRLAAAAREHVRHGRDPIAERDAARRAAEGVPTFGRVADNLIEGIEHGFRNDKHRAQWRMTLTEYARPLRSKPVDQITTSDVLAVLQPVWQAKAETASRLRGRIERVLDAAKAKGYRNGENPARWRGHLDSLLPKRQKLARGHHAAMPFDAVPGFMGKLRDESGIAARALEFSILTAARTGETIGATRDEIDLEGKLWTIPAARMKAGREHRVPLCARAVSILREMLKLSSGKFVFPGAKPNKPLSQMALAMALRRLQPDVTVHGFRSAFRDWAGERTHFPREIAEAALAHVVGDATERAYRRGDALDKRRKLMEAWAAFCEPKAGNVVPLARTKV